MEKTIGIVYEWYSNGQLESRLEYDSNEFHGVWERWVKDGSSKGKEQYDYGK